MKYKLVETSISEQLCNGVREREGEEKEGMREIAKQRTNGENLLVAHGTSTTAENYICVSPHQAESMNVGIMRRTIYILINQLLHTAHNSSSTMLRLSVITLR